MPWFDRATIPGRITPEDAFDRIGSGEAVLLDVREQAEYDAGHSPAALHLPLSRLIEGAALPQVARDRPVVITCRSGHRSRHAAALLARRGIDAVDIVGGMRAWERADLPVRNSRGRPGRIT